jgi:hypothetical protein
MIDIADDVLLDSIRLDDGQRAFEGHTDPCSRCGLRPAGVVMTRPRQFAQYARQPSTRTATATHARVGRTGANRENVTA